MSRHSSSNDAGSGASSRRKLLLAALLLGITVVLFFAARVGNEDNVGEPDAVDGQAKPEAADLLDLTHDA